MRMSGGLRQAKAAVCLWRAGSSAHNLKVTDSNPVPATIYLSRQSPDERRLKTPLRLFVVIGKLGPPRHVCEKCRDVPKSSRTLNLSNFPSSRRTFPGFLMGCGTPSAKRLQRVDHAPGRQHHIKNQVDFRLEPLVKAFRLGAEPVDAVADAARFRENSAASFGQLGLARRLAIEQQDAIPSRRSARSRRSSSVGHRTAS
jgi:hypothetical protein